MEYNTSKSALIIPEYGRHVQILVDHCKKITDRKERNQFAESIIDIMGNISPHLRDVSDFKHKLWDQLFILADFDLDVDSPYPIPSRETLNERPKTMKYPTNLRSKRYYGKIVQNMIDKIKDWEEGDKKDGIALAIANQMKRSYLIWNKDQVDDKVINDNLLQMSDNKLTLKEEDELIESKELTKGMGVIVKRKATRKKSRK